MWAKKFRMKKIVGRGEVKLSKVDVELEGPSMFKKEDF